MSVTAWIFTAGFATLVVLGMPFAFAIALCVLAAILITGIEPMLLPQTMVGGTQSFSLLAIPFFMLAGELMSAGGLSQRLVRTSGGARVPAVEVMLNTQLVSELVEKGDFSGVKEAMEKSMAEGSQTFEDDIARMIRNDIIDQKEGLAYADSPTNLMWKLGNTAPGQTPVHDPVKHAAAAGMHKAPVQTAEHLLNTKRQGCQVLEVGGTQFRARPEVLRAVRGPRHPDVPVALHYPRCRPAHPLHHLARARPLADQVTQHPNFVCAAPLDVSVHGQSRFQIGVQVRKEGEAGHGGQFRAFGAAASPLRSLISPSGYPASGLVSRRLWGSWQFTQGPAQTQRRDKAGGSQNQPGQGRLPQAVAQVYQAAA